MIFALNHIAVPSASCEQVITLSRQLGCAGVEFRNDLEQELFAGSDPERVQRFAAQSGQKIFALAEVKAFNDFSEETAQSTIRIAGIAKKCGATGVSLIPQNNGTGLGNGERQANLRLSLRELKPILEDAGLVGFVEPLGFPTSSLRFKSEALDAITAVGGIETFKLIHDTFHHCLSGETQVFAAQTGIVHVSGVTDPYPAISEMKDAHRVLVDATDRLSTVNQLRTLLDGGYDGPISFEPFAPEIHALADPKTALKTSIAFLRDALEPINA